MFYKSLRLTRIAISILVFLVFLLLFLDIHQRVSLFFHKIALIQLIPSLLQVLFFGMISSIAVFVFILMMTVLFGRIYCSSLCPLGTLMDIIIRIKAKFSRKSRFRTQKPMNLLRYGILGLCILSLIFGSVSLITFLDPYSNFGRIVSNLFKPLLQLTNNGLAQIFESLGSYGLSPVKINGYQIFSILFSFSFFTLIMIMTSYRGRWFCNTICPAGTFLGIFSRFAIFQISIKKEGCTRCGKCVQVCKANCIDAKTRTIDFSRCVMCFNCIESCSEKQIRISPFILERDKPGIDNSFKGESRRKLLTLVTLGVPFSKVAWADTGKQLPKGMVPIHKNFAVSPPGSKSIEQFNNRCTACHLCVSACPTNVLKPSFLEFGWSGMMQPRMAYEVNYCSFECVRCTEVCPTGAIQPLTLDQKKTLQIGKVIFVQENCIVITEKKDCGACSEHCPTKAVKMVQQDNKLFLPVTEQKICVGCGACEHACPTTPKSIYVDGNPVHLIAEKPVNVKIEKKNEDEEDFPF